MDFILPSVSVILCTCTLIFSHTIFTSYFNVIGYGTQISELTIFATSSMTSLSTQLLNLDGDSSTSSDSKTSDCFYNFSFSTCSQLKASAIFVCIGLALSFSMLLLSAWIQRKPATNLRLRLILLLQIFVFSNGISSSNTSCRWNNSLLFDLDGNF